MVDIELSAYICVNCHLQMTTSLTDLPLDAPDHPVTRVNCQHSDNLRDAATVGRTKHMSRTSEVRHVYCIGVQCGLVLGRGSAKEDETHVSCAWRRLCTVSPCGKQ